ncbi:glycosyltransferase family 4 protein [Bisporella sp. PMI_857]|nr:glycosyltransferase family 4 protein [Bisporella sp. PMI_857]
MAKISGVEAAGWHELLQGWWQYVLVGFILFSVGLGGAYLLVIVFTKIYRQHIRQRSSTRTVPLLDKRYLADVAISLSAYKIRKKSRRPANFGVYLGQFTSPPTEAQIQVLTEWDLLIIDPFQPGVIDTICSGAYSIPPQCLARLDLEAVASRTTERPIVAAVQWLSTIIESSTIPGSINGVLISSWESSISIPLLREFIKLLSSVGLLAYLEAAAPKYLSEPKLAEITEVTGIVIRNGTISGNGEERDAFQMVDMRPTIKAFVSQACLRDFVVLVWETLDDDARPLNAVIKRCYTWSKFYNALPWIGFRSNLISAKLCLNQKEPFGAFDWLKELKVMSLHGKWRSNRAIRCRYLQGHSDALDNLLGLLSIDASILNSSSKPSSHMHKDEAAVQLRGHPWGVTVPSNSTSGVSTPISGSSTINPHESHSELECLNWLSVLDRCAGNVISHSLKGSSYDYLGCFPLGCIVTRQSFMDVVTSQQRLKDMRLLDEIQGSNLRQIGQNLEKFCKYLSAHDGKSISDWLAAIQDLAQKLSGVTEEGFSPIRAFIGLDSGFHIENGARFWAVYSADEDSVLDIYISRNVEDITGTILHTFLSSQGCPRHECFQAEIALSEWSMSIVQQSGLPRRMQRDISTLSPAEVLQFLQSLYLSLEAGDPLLVKKLQAACEMELLGTTDFNQLKDMSTIEYLSGRASPRDLIASRIGWYRQAACQCPDEASALQIFLRVDESITALLRNREISQLQSVTGSLSDMIRDNEIDSRIDLIALSILCSMRRHAFDEAYLEVTDRNTLFNDQSDQAAAFAELFATGARCEAYFDITPSAFGKLLSDRYRFYHHKLGHEPPLWSDQNPATPSAYAAAKIDIDGQSRKSGMSAPQRFTFLSVFAIPALFDILLLTATDRGLYLSGYMTYTEQHSATLALMISLLISGAVGTWITCGGSYYLISMAFSAMNMFVVTRLVTGLAFTLIVAAIGFAAVSATEGIVAGVIFVLYLLALTAYLCLLAALANFQYTGSAFQSGRPIIVMVIPFLFISPIIAIWVHEHDIIIYLSVIYIFIILLVLGVRYTGSRWTTWYLNIEKISDQDLREWYIETQEDGNEQSLVALTDPAVLKLARTAVTKELQKASSWPRRSSTDPFVQKLAKSYDATVFLLEWYSGYSGTPLPIPFSSTWNMQTKVALQTLKQLQTGIRLHNAFIHWRQAGDEVGCSILYFIVALLDKWTALLGGGQLLGLSIKNAEYRMPVGFALAYYLIGAVLLDFNANKLHTMAGRGQNMLIGDVTSIPEAVKGEISARKTLYWRMLGRYLFFHVWSLAVSSSLLWVFNSTRESTIMFIAYVGAYTGLLWFQYTKIFAGPRSLKPLLVAVLIGIPLGQLLRHFIPEFPYCDVISLAVATWTAGVLSLYYARIKLKSTSEKRSGQGDADTGFGQDGNYHSISGPKDDPMLSQDELRIFYDNLSALTEEERYRLDPETQPGQGVKTVILHSIKKIVSARGRLSSLALEAFPDAIRIFQQALSAFEGGNVVIDCVSMAAMSSHNVQAISYTSNGNMRIIVGCENMDESKQRSISIFCQFTAEILVHSIAEAFLGFSHDDACLSESLLSLFLPRESPVSQRVRNHIDSLASSTNIKSFAQQSDLQTLRYISLGYDPDLAWEGLPRYLRELVVRRCTGRGEMLTKEQQTWVISDKALDIPIRTFVARCNFGAYVTLSNRKYALEFRRTMTVVESDLTLDDAVNSFSFSQVNHHDSRRATVALFRGLKTPFSSLYHNIGIGLKLIALAFVAEPELQRELDYALKPCPKILRSITMFMITSLWVYTKRLQNLVLPFFLLYGRGNVRTLWGRIGGTTVTIQKRQRISLESNAGLSTAFIHAPYGEAGTFKVYQYSGNLDREPTDKVKLQRISTYNKGMHLLTREDYSNGAKTNFYKYEYSSKVESTKKRLSKGAKLRYPALRICIEGNNKSEEHIFNKQGLVQRGSYILHGSLVRFSCHYRQASNFEDDLLRAEFVLPHMTCTVSWSAPPSNHPERLDTWIPSSQVMEATFVLGSDVYESRWIYDHKFHPTILTTLNGGPIDTPPIIQFDHLGVLKKPTNYSFSDDDPLLSFKSLKSRAVARWFGYNTHRTPVSTSRARSRLWKAWKETPGFDGVITRWLDEKLLRKEPLMRSYWRNRDRGRLASAEAFLNDNVEGIMATVDLDNAISGWTPLAMKIADFYSFGQGGDANSRTRSKAPDFDDGGLQVLAVDSGTWPNEGGGVSACRRDMINNLRSVKWHMIAESANDFGLPKHQTEMNVRSLKVIPLWGLDFLTPTHGLFKDRLDTEVEHVPRDATKLDVKRNFLPILTALVKGARTTNFSHSDILQTTRALINLNAYFSESKHWGAVWTSSIVKDAWRNLWIAQDLVSPTPSEGWFQTEIPTISQLDGALELWFRYLFIFSIPLPERIPAIFQASHHSVSASYGIVCKIKRGCTLQIWDHAISWRETNLYLSSDLCTMAPFVRNALLGLMRITSQLVLHHADTILPCADFFNPGWEVEIGTSQGRLEHRNTFRRKIDPVVNGIPDMTKFKPINTITSTKPTVTMLSHVWYAKDIKTAILAADIIVNEWGFKDYRLDIYGAIDKAPSYSTDCFEIIASKSLPRYVTLCGEANPTTVLEKTWVFLNSSISEGLPLALGEAALTGAPVVCTDVGASLRVLTDPDTGECYSSVVAPNDARNLARAQINFLALLDEWSGYAEDPEGTSVPILADKPSNEDIERITRRMYEKAAQRQAIGMRSREIVQKSFGGERYLREHEQMLWIGKSRYDLRSSSSNPEVQSETESGPIASNIWGTTILQSPKRRFPVSSVQTSTMMSTSLQASTLTAPAIKDLFDCRISGGFGTSTKNSTLFEPTPLHGTPVRKLVPARVTILRKAGYESSGRSSMVTKVFPAEDSFLHDITVALERV